MNTTQEEGKSRYVVYLSSRAEKDLDKLSRKNYQTIRKSIQSLYDSPRPHGCTKIGDNLYRIRVGNWRIIYIIYDKEKKVAIARVKRRNESTYNQ